MILIKIRVEGLPLEVAQVVDDFKQTFEVLTISKPYKNRTSDYVRVYVDVDRKEQMTYE